MIHSGDVFDPEEPGEDRWFYRVINRLHRNTRERVLRRLLLFESGDPYSRRVLDESARILREAQYLYDADVRPVRYGEGRVDIEVRSRDVWSLQGGVGFGRSGGENRSRIGLEDENFLGLGFKLGFERATTVDRTSSLFEIRQSNFLGRRVDLELEHSDNSDGARQRIRVERPFYSLDSRWSAGLLADLDERVEAFYRLGHAVERFSQQRRIVEGWAGFSSGLTAGHVRRWRAGLTAERDRFGPAEGYSPPTRTLPERTLVYPWISLESIEDGYFIARDLDKIERSEDRNLGAYYRVRLGAVSKSLGADRDRALLDMEYRVGLEPGEEQILFFEGHASGRFGEGRPENLLVGGSVRYYLRSSPHQLLFAEMAADATWNLDSERQLLLGGDSGLRGYPLRYQDGDRRALITLEQRFFTDWHLLKLIRVGAAAFVDVGRAWYHDDPQANPFGWLRDVGVGLRLGSSRSSAAALVHIDLAMPLDGGGSISKLQVLVGTKETF